MALKAKPLGGASREKLVAALQEVVREPVERLNVNVPKSKLKAFKLKAATEDKTMSELVNQWINAYLDVDQEK